MRSKTPERSPLSIFRLGHQFSFKLNPIGKACAFTCFFALASHSAFAQNKVAVNALPTGGQVVAGSATISSSQTATSATMNINQTSQRAVINWNTFNVGKNATVNFNQPNSSAVTLNRVTSATPSMIEGAIKANGQVILVNPNGVNFGKGAQVHAAGVVASTLDINNKDFMEGRNTYSGNGQGKIVNEGKIVATDPNGYIALLAPEVRNEGYLLARKGAGSTIAIASGEKITLDFRGTQLVRVSVDVATYKGLIENKRVIETNGGLVVLAAGTARDLMSSLIQNTGRISANAIVDNGGVIDIVATNVNQAGTVSANGKGANSTGGQINIVGENITLAANSKTAATGQAGGGAIQIGVGQTAAANTPAVASTNVANAANAKNAAPAQTATQILANNPQAANQQAKTVTVEEGASVNASAITQGNGGAIVIWSQVKTVVNGVLSAVGGYLNGNGGLIETSSAGTVALGKNLSVTTAAPKGKSGLWFLDPIDLTIDGSAANVISAALTNNSVSIAVNGNVCPSLGSCTQNGTGSLTIASGANILKESGNLTTLTLSSSGIFNLNADISGQNLNVIINSSIAYLNVGSTINANQVTVQAQSVYSYGTINAGNSTNLGSAIQLLASAIYVSGGLQVGTNLANSNNSTSSSNTISYNGTLIRREDLPNYLAAANQTTVNLDQVYSTTAANQSSYISSAINQITLTGTDSITISATAQLLANGTFGGSITASAAQINLLAPSQNSGQSAQGSGSLIQANGNNGPGGTIALTAANDFNINSATISANGSTDGGSIRLITSAGNLLLSNSLIQTNGGTGRGGSLGVSAANDTTINSSTLEATGFTKGGTIMVGYDSAGKSLPFSQSTTIDASTILNANQTDGTNSTDGGLIETSGGTLVQLASINAGRGGMWLLDPYDYVVDSTQAGYFNMALNNGFSVSLNTLNPTYSDAGYTISISGKSGTGIIYINSDISSSSALSASASLTFTADTIRIGANISTQGSQTYNGNVVVLGAVRLITNGANLTITGTVSGGYVANQVLMLLGNGGYSILNNGTVILAGNLTDGAVATSITGGALSYSAALGYLWTPTYSSISSALVVGGGGGGGAYFGGGGGGGAVVSNDALSLSAGTTYKIGVGYGGIGFLGGNGSSGTASFIQSGSSTILTATGGLGGTASNGTGGMGGDGSYGGGSSPDVNGGGGGGGNASNGTSVSGSYAGAGGFGVISSITGYQAYYGVGGGGGAAYGGTPGGSTQVVLNSPGSPQAGTVGGNLTNGVGGVYTSAGCKGPCDGHYAMPNSGSGGGGGGGNGSTGGNGANGVVIIHIVADTTSTLTISTVNQTTAGNGGVYLSAVNGSGASSSKLTYLNITAGVAASRISGNIQGNMNLDFAGWSWNGVYGSMSFYGTNSYVGNTSVSGGTLQVGSDTAFGAIGNTINMVAGGAPTVDLNGHSLPAYTINVLGFGISSKGALINSNASTPAEFAGAINLTGASYFGGPGAMVLTGMVNTQNYGLGFVNNVAVSASNAQNQISTIAGSDTGAITIVSNTPLKVGMVNNLSGFSNVFGALNLYGKDSLLIANSIAAQTIFLYGYSANNIGVEIEEASLHATTGGINIYGNGGYYGSGVYIGGTSLIKTDASNGNIVISGYAPRLGVTFGGFGGSGGRTNTTATSTSPLAIDSANNISINGYADYTGTNGDILGINLNAGLSTAQYALLNARGNGSIYLSGAAPNCNCSSYTIGAAISLVNTPLNSANGITMGGARLMNLGIVNGVSIGNVAASTFEGGLSLSSITSNQYANGGFQPYGVNISNSSTVQYAGQSYSNTVAAGSISIFGSSSSGIGVNSSSNFNSGSGSLEIGATGNGQSNAGGINLTGSITKGGAEAANISISSTYNVALGNITDTASAPILIAAGAGIAAGTSTGGTITSLGTISLPTNSPVYVGLSTSSPTANSGLAGSIEYAAGITRAQASAGKNVQYGVVGGVFTHAGAYTGGNFVNYRVNTNVTYNVTLGSDYSAVYGTPLANCANCWLANNATISSISGTGFGYTTAGALANLQVRDRINEVMNWNVAQSGTAITSASLFSLDGATINLTGTLRTYTITPAPLGVTVTGVYNNSTTFAPSSFTTYGLVNGEVINTLSSATVAFKDVLTGNNYVTGLVIGTGTASMSNYQLNPLGRVTTPNSTLQNMVTITPREVQVTGASAANKVYDGTTTAVVNIGTTINGKISGDDLTVTMTSGSFMSPGVGTGISVSGSGSLQGASASNYTLGATLLSANITQAPLGVTVTGTYSNSTTITPTSFTTNGLVNGETIVTLTSAIVSNKNVAANGSNYVTSITKGNGTATLNNYAINTSYNASSGNTQNTATIDPKVLSVSGTAVADKVYNGTASATLTNGVLNGVNPGDSITLTQAGEFSQANVGTSITVVARDTISDSSGNYTLQQPQTLNASITPKLVTLSATKTYDATTSLTGVVTIGGLVGSETLNYTGATAYSANAGGVNFIAAMTLANGSNGGLASNYVLPSLGTFANAPVTITPKALNLSANKVYDATTSLTGAITINGLISGQTLNYSGATAHTANAGSTYIDAITITDGTGGGLASNYQVPTLTSAYTYNNVTINRKAVTLSASKVYDGSTDLAGAVSVGGLIGSQTLSYTGAIASDINVATSNKYILNIALSDGTNGGVATNYSLPVSGLTAVTAPVTITPKALTVTGTTVPDKVYDGTTTTVLAGGTLQGVIGSEVVNLIQSGTFASANAGNNVAVVANDSLSGNAAVLSNYALVQPTTTTGNITPKNLTVTGTTVANKVYDGTGMATLTGGTLVGVVPGDNTSVSLTQAGVFSQWNTGGAIAVLPSDSISGPKAANYTLTQPTGLGADITPRPLGITVTGVYNGTNAISVTSFTTNGLVTGEAILTLSSVSVSDPNVAATGKYVGALLAYTGNTSSGSVNQFWGSNYSITQAYNPTAGNTQNIATITPIALTVTGTTVPNKVYDGSTATTLANGVLNGVINGQTVGLVQAGTFASPNAGSNVAVVANDSLSGDAAVLSNYTLIQPTTTTGNITPAPVIVNNTSVANKTYDGTNVATLTGGTLSGVIAGDLANVTLNQSGTFASVNVGNAIAVTATDSLSGTKAANYTLTQPSVSAANITPAPLGISINNALYRASTSLEPVGLNFTVTGLVHGETITTLGSATVANANVSANGSNYLTAMTVGSGTATLSNYSLNSGYSAAVNNTQNKVTLTPMLVTVTGTTVPDKVYDGTTTTTLANGVLVGVFSADRNNVSLNQSGTFASPNAGNNVAVVANDSLNLTASAIGNYTLVQPTTTTGNITPAPVTVNNTNVSNKVYDGTNIATLTNGTLSGVIAGDLGNVTLNQSGTFASVNVGNAIAVTATDSLSGSKAANYVLTQPIVSSANITPKTLTVTGTIAANKVYDGTDAATLTGGSLVGVVNGETVTLTQAGTFASVNAGNGITVSASDSISGATAGNYTLIQPTAVSANITPKALTVTGTTVPDKVYDGSTATTLAGGTLVGVVARDVGSVTLNQAGTFASPNAGTNVAVVANDSLNLTASAVGNYTLIQPTTTTGNITKAPLGVTVMGIYSGAAIVPTSFTTSGLRGSDTITALSSATPYDPNVATPNNYVTAITIGAGTASMNNYALTQAFNASTSNTQNTVQINPKAVTISGSKVYDGITDVANGTIIFGGLVGSQTLNYIGTNVNNANVGSNRYITQISLQDGSNGGIASNYYTPSGTSASVSNTFTITPKVVSLSANKIYDATTNLAGYVSIATGVGSETLTYAGATANNANVSANGVNYVSAITLADGTGINAGLASNYVLPSLTAVGVNNNVTINPKALNLSATKTYDATGILTGNVTINGLIGSQTLTYIGATAHSVNTGATYIDAITITDGAGGGLASNYQQPTLTGAYTYNNVTIIPKVVSISASKVYDGGTDLAGAVTISGLVGSQTLSYTNAAANDSNVATAGKYISYITLANGTGTYGGLAGNYQIPTLNLANAPVTITPKALTVTSVTANNKVYDATTSVTFSNAAGLVGVIGSDNVLLTQAGSFASKNVGTSIAVTANDSISGTSASNYTLVQPTGITANITPAPLGVTVTGIYNGTTTITPTSFTTTGLQGNDTITSLSSAIFSYPNVLNTGNMPTYVTAVTIGGGSASMSNYSLNPAWSANVGNTQNIATVTPKALTLTATKVYDGMTYSYDGMSYGLNGGSVTFGGLVGSETLNYFAVRFSDANVATPNKYITEISLASGANNGLNSNYSLPSLSAASASNSATITPLMVRLSANKEYDGTTSMTGKVTISGLVGNETLNYTGATAISANVGSNYINAIALADGANGGLASNYQTPNLTLAYTNNNAQVTAKSISISATKVYDATTDLTNAITITGLVGNQTLNYSGATANSANVLGASYINAITFADGANGGLERNYIVPTLTGANTNNRATITPAPLSLSGTKTYDGGTTGGNGTLNIGGLIGAQTLVSSNVTVNDPNVGTDKFVTAVTLADGTLGGIASNYALPSLTAASTRNNGSITPKDLTITVSAQTKTYGDGIAQTSNTQDGSIRVGTTITPTGDASNVDTRNTTTLAQIQYVNYTGNAANGSTAGFSVDGLVANDAVRTVNISSTGGALTANASVNGVSTYAITASGAVGTGLSNYNINYVTNNYSVLTVTPRPLTIRVNNATMAYGAPVLPNFSATVTGQVNGDQANVTLSTTATAYANGVAGSNTGSYDITPVSVNNPNYYVPTDLAHVTKGSLTVTPVNLTITAGDQGGPGSPILYGTPTVLDQSRNALTSVGLTNGDYILGATITYNGSQTISGVTPAGTYNGGLQISSATGTGLTNYNISYTPGNLTIGRAVLTVTAANDAKLQGQADAVNSNYNGVIFSGFKNGENVGTVDLTGLTITRTNSTVDAVGTYTGVLQVAGVTSTNYSIAYGLGNYTIVGPGQLLIKVAPALTQYGTQAVYANPTAAYIPATVTNPTANSAVTLTASMYAPGVIMVTDGTSSMNVNFSVANAVNSSSGNLAVGAYGLDSRVQPATSAGFASQFTSTVTVGGLTVTPKVLTFADFGVSGVSKVYDGSTSMSNIGFAPATTVFIQRDMVNPVANGSFADRNVGANKGYTVGVTFAGTDAANYAMSGGAIYTADGANLTNHGPANGTITQLNSVTYVGAATGGAWSDPASWRVTNGATTGAIPDLANVANIVVNAGNTVVYDPGVIGPVQANLANAGNVNFATNTTLAISMNISGAGSITISGTGQVSLSGNNTYTGNSIINNGARLIAVSGNSVGAGNIQGLGGTFQGTPGAVFAQINATGSLILASDITTTGNQTYGNVTVSQPRTTLLSQNGSITFNGTVDSSAAKANTLLVQTPTGTVSFRGSVGSIAPINVLEVDAVSTYLYADVLTSDQQNYCGAGGCYTALTLPQVTENYCAQNDCYSKNNDTSAYNLLATGTGGSGNFAKNPNLGQVFIGDNGQVGFLFNTYNSYATSAFGATAPLLNNNPVFARTLISRDPMVNFGSYISDASANATHTMQVAAIQVPGVAAAPTVQLNGSGSSQAQGTYHSALFSLNALTQSVAATNSLAGSIKNAANSTLETFKSIALGSNSIGLSGVSLATQNLSLAYPPSSPAPSPLSVRADRATINGRATTTIGGRSITPFTPATTSAPATVVSGARNSFIMSSVSQQTKLDRKYAVEASVDVGEIEMDDRPADKEKDEEERKKKKGGKTT